MSVPMPETEDNWIEAAYNLGCDHARAAASWVTDGNESDESRRHKLSLFQEGDPAIDDYLPKMPDLSGEYADGMTDARLAREITGEEQLDSEVQDRLSTAYLDGVSETFQSACEEELLKWVGTDS